MKNYELVILIHPDLEMDIEKPLTKIRSIIADNGGNITKEDNWGKKKLAYKIVQQDYAVYRYFELDLPPLSVKKVQNTLNISDEVIRYLLTAVDPRAAIALKLAADKAAKVAEAEESKKTEE
ncbi:MAG TPA: 30S ribosomal protein S6 [Patescibacteria group bacterium]|jgi:small subunit ribosomal protein S6|nr:30S ribosomal protein S6 [Patescibacteria group bacterium]